MFSNNWFLINLKNVIMYWIPFYKKPILLNTREKKPLPVGNKSNSFQYIKNKSWGGGRGGAYRCISRRLVIRLQGRVVQSWVKIWLEHQIIKLWAKRTKLNLLFKLSYLNYHKKELVIKEGWYCLNKSIYISGKIPTYPSPKITFCPKWEVSVNVSRGGVGVKFHWSI